MPQNRPTPSPIVSSVRHCTAINIALPIGALAPCVASFTVRHTREDGSFEDVADGSVTLTPEEFGALPAFPAAYAQLRDAVHAKRATYDPAQ